MEVLRPSGARMGNGSPAILEGCLNELQAYLDLAKPQGLVDLQIACPTFEVSRSSVNDDIEFRRRDFAAHDIKVVASVFFCSEDVDGFVSVRAISVT